MASSRIVAGACDVELSQRQLFASACSELLQAFHRVRVSVVACNTNLGRHQPRAHFVRHCGAALLSEDWRTTWPKQHPLVQLPPATPSRLQHQQKQIIPQSPSSLRESTSKQPSTHYQICCAQMHVRPNLSFKPTGFFARCLASQASIAAKLRRLNSNVRPHRTWRSSISLKRKKYLAGRSSCAVTATLHTSCIVLR